MERPESLNELDGDAGDAPQLAKPGTWTTQQDQVFAGRGRIASDTGCTTDRRLRKRQHG
jgi:hypothetical protein